MPKKGFTLIVVIVLSVAIIVFFTIVPIQPAVISVLQIEEETLKIKECYQTKVAVASSFRPFQIFPLIETPGDYTLEVYLYSQGNLITSERTINIGDGEYKITLAFWGSTENLEVRFILLNSDGTILSDLLYAIP